MDKVIFETRICAAALAKGRAPAHLAFRAAYDPAARWMTWIPGRGGQLGAARPSTDHAMTDTRSPWYENNANIYRDHCTYLGDNETGYFRRKDRVCAVNGYMLDFDSHTANDMPLEDIRRILTSDDFMNRVPYSRLVMSGHGFQAHFTLPATIDGSDSERQQRIADYERHIRATMAHCASSWHLRPDPQCKDITRLHRLHPSYNTKELTAVDDTQHRIPVELLVDRQIEISQIHTFLQQVGAALPAESPRPRARRQQHAVQLASSADQSPPPPPSSRTAESDTPAPTDAMTRVLEPPCVKTLWENGASEGRRNAARFALLARMHAAGITQGDATELLQTFNSRCRPPDETAAVVTHVARFYREPTGEIGCTYVRENCGTCAHQDHDIAIAKRSCAFAGLGVPPGKPDHPYELGPNGNVLRRETRMSKDGATVELMVPVTESGHMIVEAVVRDGETTMFAGRIVNGDWHTPFELPASLWANRIKFAETVKGLAGDKLVFQPANAAHLSLASELLCPEKQAFIVTEFGWDTQLTRYYGTDCVIDKTGIRAPTAERTRGTHDAVRRLRLAIPTSDAEVARLLTHIKNDLLRFSNPGIMAYAVGLAFVAPFLSVLRRHASTTNAVPSLIILGTTGKGKTAIAILVSSFFGHVRESDIVSFASTPRVVNDLGHWFKDALFPVDDLKWSSLNQAVQSQIVGIFQAYVDGHGRSRLTNRGAGEWEPQTGKEIRGALLVTAEDVPSGEASVFARLMLVHLDQSESDSALYGRCLSESRNYPMVMASFLHWYLQAESPHRSLLDRFDALRRAFEEGVPRERVNIIRVCAQLALNLCGYELFVRFAASTNVFTAEEASALVAAHEARLRLLRDQRLTEIAGETPAEKFLAMVVSLLAAGRARLDDGLDDRPSTPIIGFQERDDELDREILYLDPRISYGLVQRAYSDMGERIPFTVQSLGQQLLAHRYLARRDRDRLTYSKVRCGRKGRYYAIDLTRFDWDVRAATRHGNTPPEAPIFPEGPGIDEADGGGASLGLDGQ